MNYPMVVVQLVQNFYFQVMYLLRFYNLMYFMCKWFGYIVSSNCFKIVLQYGTTKLEILKGCKPIVLFIELKCCHTCLSWTTIHYFLTSRGSFSTYKHTPAEFWILLYLYVMSGFLLDSLCARYFIFPTLYLLFLDRSVCLRYGKLMV